MTQIVADFDDGFTELRTVHEEGERAAHAASAFGDCVEESEIVLGHLLPLRNGCCARLAEDIAYCARESVLDVVPVLARMEGAAAEIVRRTG